MYSSELMKIMTRIGRISHFLGSSPLLINPKNGVLYTTKWGKLKSFFLWEILTIYVLIYVPYQVCQMLKVKNFDDFNFLIILCMCAVNGVIVLSVINFRADEVAQCINFGLGFLKKFERKLGNSPNSSLE